MEKMEKENLKEVPRLKNRLKNSLKLLNKY